MQLRTILALCCTVISFAAARTNGLMRKDELKMRQLEAAKRFQPSLLERRGSSAGKNLTFSNPKAAEFWVNGSAIPEVDWDVGDSYAGLIPISDDPNETRKVSFWYVRDNKRVLTLCIIVVLLVLPSRSIRER